MTPKRPRTRIYVQGAFEKGQTVPFDRDQSAYLGKVLRLKDGASVGLFNEVAGEWCGILRWLGKRDAAADIRDQICAPEPDAGPVLAFAPIKKTPLEWLCVKATELGVRALQPVITDYTQAELSRVDRLKLLLTEASEQSERCRVPSLNAPCKLMDWLDGAGTILVAAEAGETVGAREWAMKGQNPDTLLIGPEGGFSQGELATFAQHPHVTCLNLGPRILKAETAGLSLLTIWQLAHGDFVNRPAFRS